MRAIVYFAAASPAPGLHALTSSPAAASVSRLPVLRLKRGEERRLGAGHLWVFSNEVDTDAHAADGLRARGARASCARTATRSSATSYVNPHALICARILSRRLAQPVDAALLEQRLRAALALRERSEPGAVLPLGVRRVRPAAGTGARSLRRGGRRPDRHRRHGGAEGADRGRGARGAEPCGAVLEERLRGARARAAARGSPRPPSATSPRQLTVREAGLTFAVPLAWRPEDRLVLRPDRQPAAARGAMLRAGARVLDVCSYVGAWAVSGAEARRRAARCASIPRRAALECHAGQRGGATA